MTGHQWAGTAYTSGAERGAHGAASAAAPQVVVLGEAEAPTRQEVVMPPLPPGLEDTVIRAPESREDSAPAGPAPIPGPARSSVELMPGRVRPDRRAARKGWRAVVRRATLGVITPRAGQSEIEEAADRAAVNVQLSTGKTVVVANPKGGAGKSPTVLGLAAAFGEHRGGAATVAWDNNETLGTLGIRTEPGRLPTTAVDLLANLEEFERVDARRGDLGRFLRHQESGQFDVLVSDEDPARMSEIGDVEYDRIHAVLRRWNDVVVVDTGNNPRAANFLAAIESADLLVIPVRWATDVVVSAGRLIDQLRANGHGDLVARSVTVVTGAAAPAPGAALQTAQWREWFTAQTAAVVEVPYDRHLAAGESIVHGDLTPATRRAYLRVAAAVARGFADLDAATEYARIQDTHR